MQGGKEMKTNIVTFNINGNKYEVGKPKNEFYTPYTPTFVRIYRNQSVTTINVNEKRYERTFNQ